MQGKTSNISFLVIVALFLVYAAVFIYQTSFIVKGERYFSLHDDMMISMRYAKNLAAGQGLVWNPGGERVEGFTNPLWVLFMALLHLFPIPASKISLVVQLTGAIFLALNLIYVRKIADFVSDGSILVTLGAVLLTAFYLPIINWSLQGMEVSLLVLLTTVAVWLALNCLDEQRFSLHLYILLAVGTFVRPDMVVPYVFIMLFVAFTDQQNRRQNIVFGSLILAMAVCSQTGLRWLYYGELLPNTYYLKLTGYPLFLRMTRGLYVLARFIWQMNPLLVLLPLIVLYFKRDKRKLLLLWIFAGQLVYSVYVGGDAWEDWGGSNRYISIAIPTFFVLLSFSLFSFLNWAREKLSASKAGVLTGSAAFFVLLVGCLISVNSFGGVEGLKQFAFLEKPSQAFDNKTLVTRALMLKVLTAPQASIAVVWAGALPYFADRYTIDMLGKNDKRIASGEMRILNNTTNKYTAFYPGHMKFDYDYSIKELKPDVVVQLWQDTEEIDDYLERYYKKEVYYRGQVTFYMLKGSPNVLNRKIVTN